MLGFFPKALFQVTFSHKHLPKEDTSQMTSSQSGIFLSDNSPKNNFLKIIIPKDIFPSGYFPSNRGGEFPSNTIVFHQKPCENY